MREYVEFPNLCFVDTLDSVEGLSKFRGQQEELFGALSGENYERIKRQNQKKISVVIGNPPYNANQISENDNNKNRKYPEIDSRIKKTYIDRSTAQKTKLYDMYVRFFRWASDRINNAGIVAFITNRSFIDASNFDGFRSVVGEDFDEVYIIDLGGDWKKGGLAGGGNVFEIGTGVAISFWIRRPSKGTRKAKIRYAQAPQGSGEDKLAWISSLNDDGFSFRDIAFEEIAPQRGHWVGNPENIFESEIPLASKAAKSSRGGVEDKTIFKLFSLGISTNRDDWVYDVDDDQLLKKVRFLKKNFDGQRSKTNFDDQIKWSETLKRRSASGQREAVSAGRIRSVLYRPYSGRRFYASTLFVDRPGALSQMFPDSATSNPTILVAVGQRGQFGVCATDRPTSLDFFVPNAACLFTRKRYSESGRSIDNIPDWALKQFSEHYKSGGKKVITKDAIFFYVYGVLHDPAYREKYALNLKREMPRIPFYRNFWLWAEWGEKLMSLHIGYESQKVWPLKRINTRDKISRDAELQPDVILKADKGSGVIKIDSETQLGDIPKEVWSYKIGSRSALEWVLDQHGENKPRSEILRKQFDADSFATRKEAVVKLIGQVTRVSVETQQVVEAMRSLPLSERAL
jgi:predicted helicase